MVHHTKQHQGKRRRFHLSQVGKMMFLVFACVGLVGGVTLSPVFADQYEERIKKLEKEQEKQQRESDKLAEQAGTIEEQISSLQQQIASIQAQINTNEAKHKDLTKQIEKAKKDLEYQKKILGKNIRAMYIEGQVSTTEMLASSSDINVFFDKQQYRNTVKDKISATAKKIADLRAQLDEQQREVEKLLAQQKELRSDLSGKQRDADAKLAQTNQKKSEFDDRVSQLSEDIAQAYAEQQAALAAARQQWTGGYINVGGSGGYPWASAPYPCWSSDCVDPWALYYRECTSYTAWRLTSQGYGVRSFSGAGHAREWPGTTSGYTSQTIGQPSVGAAAVDRYVGAYGHVMYVEAVMGDSIKISEYNFVAPGEYSERIVPASTYSNWVFITFPKR